MLDAKGKHAEAEASLRRGLALLIADPFFARHLEAASERLRRGDVTVLAGDPFYFRQTRLDEAHVYLARNLMRQGRLLEAENEARQALLGALVKRGRNSSHTAWVLHSLIRVVIEQGRYAEAERLARSLIDIYGEMKVAPDSLFVALARGYLVRTLEAQGRDREALAEYGAIHVDLRGQPSPHEDARDVVNSYAEALLRTGDVDRGLEVLRLALEGSRRLRGERDGDTLALRAAVARAYAARGDREGALREFREVTPLLLAHAGRGDDEATTPRAAERALVGILSSYIRLLAEISGTPLERESNVDASAEAFRLADIMRGRSVQRALTASAVRVAANSPALADLVRKEQDARKQVMALRGLLADVLTRPTHEQNQRLVADLGQRIDVLSRAVDALGAQIAKDVPAYAQLIDPKPLTVDQVRAMLRPGEALVSTLVTADRTFVWAIPRSGPVAFAAVAMSAQEMERSVATLRKALEPTAKTFGDIPDFDLALAHRLYATLLEPVRSAWQDGRSLLFVAHGPLAQLPIALLPTRAVTLPPESGLLFAGYRQVPWLGRSHAVTMLPSVASLVTLRALPPGASNRRAFVGFGDPYFSKEQAALAGQEQISIPVERVALILRSSPPTLDSSQLGNLPRLPETADEIRSLASAMHADPDRDVFLGARANEKMVKTLDLTGYRIIAFATHGLVPGDLDGLTQPALALSAPDVAGIDGDGLLTMDEILGLRLNADWIVLSACNTSSGQGAGGEALSGLGRAFFYAGARALLVSHWPVETTSARALTSELFRRQQADTSLGRAAALQQTLNWLIDDGGVVDTTNGKTIVSYAHPIFWAPFTLIGDGGR